MIKIVTDSACQMSPAQAKQHGIYVAPLMITINNHSYRDFEQINLPKDVYPDDSITFSYTIPRDIVCDAVKFDLVAENVCWFEEFGNSPIKV